VTDELAQQMVAAAVAKAKELGVPQVVAVLDESGLLKAFCRMDGTPLVSIEVSQNKAYTALFGMPSHEFFNFIKDDPALLAGVPHIPRIVTFGGGLPTKQALLDLERRVAGRQLRLSPVLSSRATS